MVYKHSGYAAAAMASPLPVSVLIMAGGRGSRMLNPSKPLLAVGGGSLLERIFSIAKPMSQQVYLCASPNAPEVADFARSMGINIVEGSGEDYSRDLSLCLSFIREKTVLILPADIFIIHEQLFGESVNMAMESKSAISTVLQKGEFIGISIYNREGVQDDQWDFISIEVPARFCINVNTPEDLQEARHFIEHQWSQH